LGKPYLQAYDGLQFSLSHTDEGIAFALSNKEIGVDLEGFQRRGEPWLNPQAFLNKTIAEPVLTARTEHEKKAWFYRYWTLLEAKVKRDATTLYSIKESFNLPPELIRDGKIFEHDDVYLTQTSGAMQWSLCFPDMPTSLKIFEYDSGGFLPSHRWKNIEL
jgi:hypothetical protein